MKNAKDLSPIVLFVYSRAEHTKKTLDALSRCVLAKDSRLVVYADGARENATEEQKKKIEATRQVVRDAAGKGLFKEVEIHEENTNGGTTSKHMGRAITEVINKYGTVIVVEDDIVCGVHFLEYMNSALERYKDDKRVWHITGWSVPKPFVSQKDITGSFFYPVMDCWSWGTWADRWAYFNNDTDRIIGEFTDEMIYRFNCDGTDTYKWQELLDNKSGVLDDVWDIYWYIAVFLHDGLCLAPMRSLVRNIGLDNSGEHCAVTHIYDKMNEQSIDHEVTKFPAKVEISAKEWKATKHFYWNAFVRPVLMRKRKKAVKRIITLPFRAVRKVWRIVSG